SPPSRGRGCSSRPSRAGSPRRRPEAPSLVDSPELDERPHEVAPPHEGQRPRSPYRLDAALSLRRPLWTRPAGRALPARGRASSLPPAAAATSAGGAVGASTGIGAISVGAEALGPALCVSAGGVTGAFAATRVSSAPSMMSPAVARHTPTTTMKPTTPS